VLHLNVGNDTLHSLQRNSVTLALPCGSDDILLKSTRDLLSIAATRKNNTNMRTLMTSKDMNRSSKLTSSSGIPPRRNAVSQLLHLLAMTRNGPETEYLP
jgi:hypothetical protein